MLERLAPARRNLALLLLALLLGWFCWSIRSVLNPLLLGYLLAYILHPMVVRVQDWGASRRVAVTLIFSAGFLVASAILLLLVLQMRGLVLEGLGSEDATAVVQGGQASGTTVPLGLAKSPAHERINQRLAEFAGWIDGTFGIEVDPPRLPPLRDVLREVGDFLGEHKEEVKQAAGASLLVAGRGVEFLTRFFGRMLSLAGMFVLVPLYTYYFLFELGRIHGFVERYLPARDRVRLAGVARKIGLVIANFFRGRLSVCFLKGLFLSIGLWITGVDYAFLFGMLSGFLSLIPFFGPFVGFLGALTAGMLGDHGFLSALVRTGVVFGLGEVLEGYVLLPKILGDTLGLHPMVVLFALFAGGASMGMFGILIALPLTASLVILFTEFVLPALRDFADEDGDTTPGVG